MSGAARERIRRLLGRRHSGERTRASSSSEREGELAEPQFVADPPGAIHGLKLDPRGAHLPPPPPFEETRDGDLAIRTTRFPAEHPHGKWRFREVIRRSTHELDLLAQERGAEPFAYEQSAFLDVETTSLSSGSGVLVFLTAVGEFENGDFVVRQYLMRTPQAEPTKFARLHEHLRAHRRLVTFFGKAFDRHRLLDRARFLGIPFELPPDHFDLYWMSRRLVGGRYRDGKLRTMEHELLQFHRASDLPGAFAPDAWFQMLRGEGEEPLEAALLHNLWDVVSLAALCAELSLRVEAPEDRAEWRALARVHRRDGDASRAREAFERGLEPRSSPLHWFEYADLCRRVADYPAQGDALWRVCEGSPRDPRAWEEWSKWLEHRGRDLERALRACEAALRLAPAHRRGELERRRARLLRRKGEGEDGESDPGV